MGVIAIIAVIYFTVWIMNMKTMSALDAKNSFGVFLDTVRREPVTVTKNRREVGAMFSMEDLNDLARTYLADPIRKDVENGKVGVAEALMAQTEINNRLHEGRVAISEGKGIEVNDAYFDDLHQRALSRKRT